MNLYELADAIVGAIPAGRQVAGAHCMRPNVTIGGEFPNVPDRQRRAHISAPLR
jgi:hypothetical protein